MTKPTKLARLATTTAIAALVVVIAPGEAEAQLDAACPASLPSPGYPDVAGDSVHAQGVECITWWEITLGTGFGTYDPSGRVGRDQMASFIARLTERLGGVLPSFSFADPYDDVGFDNTHQENIQRLAEVGLVQGTGPRTYNPDRDVTRGQMATFLVRSYEFANNRALPPGPDAFADDNGTTHEVNINKAAAAGFAAGSSPGVFGPDGPVFRDQMATFMARVLDVAVSEGSAHLPVETISFSGESDDLSEPFRLRSGTYAYAYDHSGDCFYDPRLEYETDDGESWVFLTSGSGPETGEQTFTDIEARRYRFEMSAGGAEPCTWSMALTRTGD